jgi:hypothetical protein
MKILLAIIFGCVLLLGLNRTMTATASSPSPYLLVPASSMEANDVTDGFAADTAVDTAGEAEAASADSEGVIEDSEAYECRISPYCQRASQCTAYCAGGIPVCSRGCCACAS